MCIEHQHHHHKRIADGGPVDDSSKVRCNGEVLVEVRAYASSVEAGVPRRRHRPSVSVSPRPIAAWRDAAAEGGELLISPTTTTSCKSKLTTWASRRLPACPIHGWSLTRHSQLPRPCLPEHHQPMRMTRLPGRCRLVGTPAACGSGSVSMPTIDELAATDRSASDSGSGEDHLVA
jgi:hypothetical protein